MRRLSGVITVVIDRFDLAKLDPAAAAIDKSFAFIIWLPLFVSAKVGIHRRNGSETKVVDGVGGGRSRNNSIAYERRSYSRYRQELPLLRSVAPHEWQRPQCRYVLTRMGDAAN